eukprot:COSAG02_NODE_49684_length_325_cov_0.845133_1_plen_89_part_01
MIEEKKQQPLLTIMVSKAQTVRVGCVICAVCCALVAANVWAGYSIYRIMSEDWQPVPGGCVVHGAWIEMHWRQTWYLNDLLCKHSCTKQ